MNPSVSTPVTVNNTSNALNTQVSSINDDDSTQDNSVSDNFAGSKEDTDLVVILSDNTTTAQSPTVEFSTSGNDDTGEILTGISITNDDNDNRGLNENTDAEQRDESAPSLIVNVERPSDHLADENADEEVSLGSSISGDEFSIFDSDESSVDSRDASRSVPPLVSHSSSDGDSITVTTANSVQQADPDGYISTSDDDVLDGSDNEDDDESEEAPGNGEGFSVFHARRRMRTLRMGRFFRDPGEQESNNNDNDDVSIDGTPPPLIDIPHSDDDSDEDDSDISIIGNLSDESSALVVDSDDSDQDDDSVSTDPDISVLNDGDDLSVLSDESDDDGSSTSADNRIPPLSTNVEDDSSRESDSDSETISIATNPGMPPLIPISDSGAVVDQDSVSTDPNMPSLAEAEETSLPSSGNTNNSNSNASCVDVVRRKADRKKITDQEKKSNGSNDAEVPCWKLQIETFPLLQLSDDILVNVLSYMADVPFESSKHPYKSRLTHILPFVCKKFYGMCSKIQTAESPGDYFWKSSLVRLVLTEDVWKDGLFELYINSITKTDDKEIIAYGQDNASDSYGGATNDKRKVVPLPSSPDESSYLVERAFDVATGLDTYQQLFMSIANGYLRVRGPIIKKHLNSFIFGNAGRREQLEIGSRQALYFGRLQMEYTDLIQGHLSTSNGFTEDQGRRGDPIPFDEAPTFILATELRLPKLPKKGKKRHRNYKLCSTIPAYLVKIVQCFLHEEDDGGQNFRTSDVSVVPYQQVMLEGVCIDGTCEVAECLRMGNKATLYFKKKANEREKEARRNRHSNILSNHAWLVELAAHRFRDHENEMFNFNFPIFQRAPRMEIFAGGTARIPPDIDDPELPDLEDHDDEENDDSSGDENDDPFVDENAREVQQIIDIADVDVNNNTDQ